MDSKVMAHKAPGNFGRTTLPNNRGVVLEQRGAALPAEGHEFESTKAVFGIYHDTLTIDIDTNRHYPSGRVIQSRNTVHIPLDNKGALVAIRDLLNEALGGEETDLSYQYTADTCPGRPCSDLCDHRGAPPEELSGSSN